MTRPSPVRRNLRFFISVLVAASFISIASADWTCPNPKCSHAQTAHFKDSVPNCPYCGALRPKRHWPDPAATAEAKRRAEAAAEAKRRAEYVTRRKQADTYLAAARDLLHKDLLGRADSNVDSAMALFPKDPTAIALRNQIRERREAHAQAEIDSKVDKLLAKAEAALSQKNFAGAMSYVDAATLVDPRNPSPEHMRSRILQLQSIAEYQAKHPPADKVRADLIKLINGVPVTTDNNAQTLIFELSFPGQDLVVKANSNLGFSVKFTVGEGIRPQSVYYALVSGTPARYRLTVSYYPSEPVDRVQHGTTRERTSVRQTKAPAIDIYFAEESDAKRAVGMFKQLLNPIN